MLPWSNEYVHILSPDFFMFFIVYLVARIDVSEDDFMFPAMCLCVSSDGCMCFRRGVYVFLSIPVMVLLSPSVSLYFFDAEFIY